MPEAAASPRPVGQSLQEYARGVAGGLVFSLPLLYTMEVWWSGFVARPVQLMVGLGATFLLLLGYNYYGGLRQNVSFAEEVIDAVEELGIGLVLATLILWLLGRVTADTPAADAVGKIVVETMAVAIGISVGRAQLGGNGGEQGGASDADAEPGYGGQIVVAFCGAVLFALNVAPTEEIQVIGVETHPLKLAALAVFSMLTGGGILYYSNFSGSQLLVRRAGGFREVFEGTVILYAVALVASAFLLWFFGRLDAASPYSSVAQTVVLALPGAIGASAGRLLLQV